jgi:hypothetical protein
MTQGLLTPSQAAQSFLAAIPHVVTVETLENYGIDATSEAARHITLELLFVNLFWIHSALHAALTSKAADRVLTALEGLLRGQWETTLGLQPQELDSFMTEVKQRRASYQKIVREGGSPIAVATELCARLASVGLVRDEDRQNLLALFIDSIPVEELGEIAAEMQVAD